jgi:hypothetical protein
MNIKRYNKKKMNSLNYFSGALVMACTLAMIFRGILNKYSNLFNLDIVVAVAVIIFAILGFNNEAGVNLVKLSVEWLLFELLPSLCFTIVFIASKCNLIDDMFGIGKTEYWPTIYNITVAFFFITYSGPGRLSALSNNFSILGLLCFSLFLIIVVILGCFIYTDNKDNKDNYSVLFGLLLVIFLLVATDFYNYTNYAPISIDQSKEIGFLPSFLLGIFVTPNYYAIYSAFNILALAFYRLLRYVNYNNNFYLNFFLIFNIKFFNM